MKKKYVSFDIETTGFDPQIEDVIEIGACIFEDDVVIDELSLLVKPGKPVPSAVMALTGIREADLENAIELEDALKQFVDFIKDYPIVGHNIQFDIGFLEAKGVVFKAQEVFDTWHLASLVIDHKEGVDSLSLEVLSQYFGISHEDSHRAFDDAVASKDLFLILLQRVYELDRVVLQYLVDFLALYADSYVYYLFFVDALQQKKNEDKQKQFSFVADDLFRTHLEKTYSEAVDLKKIDSLLLPEERDASIRVHEALSQNERLAVDYGVGLDSYLSLLLAQHSVEKKTVMLVSSEKIQKKVYSDSVERFCEVLETKHKPFFFYGEGAYFCKKSFEEFLKKGSFSYHELHFISKVIIWLSKTETGVLDELQLQREEKGFVKLIAHSSSNFDGSQHLVESESYYAQAVKRLAEATHVIAYHESFEQESEQLFDDRCLLISNISEFDDSMVQSGKRFISVEGFSSLVHSLKDLEAVKRVDGVVQRLEELDSYFALLFGLVGMALQKYDGIAYGKAVYNAQLHGHFVDNDILVAFERLVGMLQNCMQELEQIKSSIVKRTIFGFQYYLDVFSSFLDDASEFLHEFILGDEVVFFSQTPLFSEMAISAKIAQNQNGVVLAGSNIAVQNFHMLKQMYDVEGFQFEHFSSPYNYKESTKTIVVNDFEREGSDEYLNDLVAFARELHSSSRHGVVVLLRSKSQVGKVFKDHGVRLSDDGVDSFYAGVLGGIDKTATLVSKSKKPLLFCTEYSFSRMGLDRALFSTMVLTKIPFKAPLPFEIKHGNGDFMNISLPRAVFAFKELFDTLLGHIQDSGSVVILDNRLLTARYGQNFFNAISTELFKGVSKDEVFDLLKK